MAEYLSSQQKSPKSKSIKPRSSMMRISIFNKGNQQTASPGTSTLAMPTVVDSSRNRLRKSRSNSDFNGVPSIASGSTSSTRSPNPGGSAEALTKRQHSHTVSGGDMHGAPSPRLDGSAAPMSLAQMAAVLPSPPLVLDPLGEVMRSGRGSVSPSLLSPNGSLAPSISASSASFSAFGEEASTSSTEASTQASQNPFGPGITFDSPTVSSENEGPLVADHGNGENTPDGLLLLRGPLPSLRVMQSFESGMTARAGDHMRPTRNYGLGLVTRAEPDIQPDILEDTETPIGSRITNGSQLKTHVIGIDGAPALGDLAPSDSGVDFSPSIQQLAAPGAAFLAFGDIDSTPRLPPTNDEFRALLTAASSTPEQIQDTPKAHMRLHDDVQACLSEYTATTSMDCFDFVQSSRGLPHLDEVLHSRDKVLSISLESEITAQPKNDPRFVIWGDTNPARVVPSSHASVVSGTGMSAATLALSDGAPRIRSDSSVTAASQRTVESTPGSEGEQDKVMVAATIERWMAQLTSTMNYDELLVFFLTYRVYITAYDVAELLICRFHWSLGQGRVEQDESVRKIVRVRTFVAFKYWITKFFVVDFVPNAMVRQLLSRWLNALRRDPVLEMYKDAAVCLSCLVVELFTDVSDSASSASSSRSSRTPGTSTSASTRLVFADRTLGRLEQTARSPTWSRTSLPTPISKVTMCLPSRAWCLRMALPSGLCSWHSPRPRLLISLRAPNLCQVPTL
jgi:hypothetical protein